MNQSPILFIGGASSGKSRLAQQWAEAVAPERYFIATATAHDAESRMRIAQHQAERMHGWHTIEAPEDVCQALQHLYGTLHAHSNTVILIDCITLWLSNLCAMGYNDRDILAQVGACMAWLQKTSSPTAPIGIVTNELGHGIVPLSAVARRFRALHGKANQCIAAACPTVVSVTCGLPLAVKGTVPACCLH